MIIKDLKITNSVGRSIEFGRDFRIADDFIMSGLGALVNYSASTEDGSNYQSTKIQNREFDIPFFIRKQLSESFWIEDRRNLAYSVLNPKLNPFRIDITTNGGSEYYLYANLEGAPLFPVNFNNDNSGWQNGIVSFSCSDPFFYKNGDSVNVDVAVFNPSFEFPLEINPSEGIEFASRSQTLVFNVENKGQDSTGFNITFRASGYLSNPSIVNVNTGRGIKINTDMEEGDVILISTYKRRKRVTLMRNGTETNIFSKLDLDSTFLQLEIGDNLFRYNASENVDKLQTNINFVPKYLGV